MTARLIQLNRLLEQTPGDAFLLFAIAKEYEKAGDEPMALEYYRQLQATQPDYVGLYYHLGKLHERQGNPEEAIAVFRQGADVAQRAGDRHAFSELKGALMELGDED